jgi:hypothetical protein
MPMRRKRNWLLEQKVKNLLVPYNIKDILGIWLKGRKKIHEQRPNSFKWD